MKKNFTIEDAIYLRTQNQIIDLHNNYSINSLNLQFDKKEISMVLDPYNPKDNRFQIVFRKVYHFSIFPELHSIVDGSIDEIGFKGQDDFDHDWLSAEKSSTEGDHFFIRGEGSNFIRIGAEEAYIDRFLGPNL